MFNRKKIKELEEKVKELEYSLDVFNKRIVREQNPRLYGLLDEVSFSQEYYYPIGITSGVEVHNKIIEGVVVGFRFDDEDCSWWYKIIDKETKNTYWEDEKRFI